MKLNLRKLTTRLLSLSAVPLLLLGLVVTFTSSAVIYESLKDETQNNLKVLASTSYRAYEIEYPGDYALDGGAVTKGGLPLSGRHGIVDEVKRLSGADATLFYQNQRLLTTILKPDGSRATGTFAADEVAKAVLEQGQDYFSERVSVNGTPYFGYYMPVRNSDGTVAGMAFVGKARAAVLHKIAHNILLVCAASLGIMAIAIAISSHYGRTIIRSLNRTKQFLGKIACGDLAAELDPQVLSRRDEIGEMGRFAVMLQHSVTDLVGKDPLTGLHNRRGCDVVLQGLIEQGRRRGAGFAVAMGDIDYFKRVNDAYGHRAGDEVLRMVSRCMSAHMERAGFLFRWGGEEFLLIYEDVDARQALPLLQALQKEIAGTAVPWEGAEIHVTITFGVADGRGAQDADALIQRADENLYRGKELGRNRIVGDNGQG